MEKNYSNISEISIKYTPLAPDMPTIICSIDAYVLFLDFYPQDTIGIQEKVFAMYLNRANRVIGIFPVSTGGITGTVADIRLILSVALKCGATGIIISHNHPSGSLKPSRMDKELTIKLKDAGCIMDIALQDHIIVVPEEGMYLVLLMKENFNKIHL
ncbi:MAG: JAB domain-containing protein [Bacteroidetes bacterium]|nr:JAB domain-containing protein [Bacteroidota bacterium]